MTEKYYKILSKIKKNYKNTENLVEIYLENYHHNYIYIRVDYYKKLKIHKASWLDLSHYKNNFESIISYEYIPEDMISYLKEQISNLNNYELYPDNLKEKYKVTINSDLLTVNNQKYQLTFNHYIHQDDKLLYNLFSVIFDNLPSKLFCFFEEIGAAITGNTGKYECQEEFTFDLFNDDINRIFDAPIKAKGEEFYETGHVLFLEKINDDYIAVVGDTSLHVVTINYDESTHKVRMLCSCPCEFYCHHFCAVILAIRNNKFRKFYKVTLNHDNTSLLDRVMNFKYFLSIGIDDQGYHFLVIEQGQLRLLRVLNSKGESDFEILEDDEHGTLTKRLKEIVGK